MGPPFRTTTDFLLAVQALGDLTHISEKRRQLSRVARGRRRRRRRVRGQRGGLGFAAFLPQPVVNAWRDATGKIWDGGYEYAGETPPASNNPDPTHQPIDKNYDYIGGIPPDVPSINQFSGEAVAQLSTN